MRLFTVTLFVIAKAWKHDIPINRALVKIKYGILCRHTDVESYISYTVKD